MPDGWYSHQNYQIEFRYFLKFEKICWENLFSQHFNYCIEKGEFPNDSKHADIVPIYKKNKKCEKVNYRPVSILSNLCKIYEKPMYN